MAQSKNQERKKPVGRPRSDGERKNGRTCSITDSTDREARKLFKTRGRAIEWAVATKRQLMTNQPNSPLL